MTPALTNVMSKKEKKNLQLSTSQAFEYESLSLRLLTLYVLTAEGDLNLKPGYLAV